MGVLQRVKVSVWAVVSVAVIVTLCSLGILYLHQDEVEVKRDEVRVAEIIPAITVRIIDSEEQTFGYEVLVNGKVLIRQHTIPGVSGTRGFQRREDALRVAEFVAQKLRNNLPPSVSAEELRELVDL